MIKHIVCWQLKPIADGKTKQQNAIELKAKLESLSSYIPEIKSMEVGINSINSHEGNWDIVLISEFETEHDLITYQNHPKHQEVVEFVKKVRELRAAVDFC